MKLVRIQELSELTGYNRAAVRRAIDRVGLQPAASDAAAAAGFRSNSITFNSELALRALYGEAEALDPSQEKAALDRTRRELAELQLAERRHEMVPADAVRTAITSAAMQVRSQLMALPSRLAADLTSMQSMRSIEKLLSEEINSALSDLVRIRLSVAVEPQDDDD